jgi:purine-binding chemotaxis protein CheW
MSKVKTADVDEKKEINSYLSFKLGDEYFAVNVNQVIEILEVPAITKIPRAPRYMAGVINLRGNVLPLIDTRIKFSMEPIKMTVNTCVVVIEINVEGETLQIGTLVDEVLEVLEIEKSQIQPSPSIEAQYKLEFIEGMFRKDSDFIMLLNLGAVFSLSEVNFMQETNEAVESAENNN